MYPFICDKLRKLKPYDPDLNVCAIHLDANESFIGLDEALRHRIAERVAAVAFNRYPDPIAGAVCGAFGRYYHIPAEAVTASNGSDELLSLILNSFTQRGDKVLLTEPDFSMYRIYSEMAETQPVVIGKRGDLTFDPDEMVETANRENVRLVLFSNPCNPTGQGLPAARVLDIVRRAKCLVIVDEAYMDFWDEPIAARAPEYENLIVLKTCSKIGFAAARLGFAVANPTLTGLLRAAKSPYNVNAMTQAAGEELLSDPSDLSRAVSEIRRSRDRLYEMLRKLESAFPDDIRVFATHTNFVTLAVKDAGKRHEQLKNKGVSVRLLGGYFRITAGSEQENETLLTVFREILDEGKGETEK